MHQPAYSFPKKTIRDISVNNKRILLRADFNVPLDKNGAITSDYRIVKTLPTIEYLLKRNAEVIILSHLGRPEGQRAMKYTLEPVAERLSGLLGGSVAFVPDCASDTTLQALKKQSPGSVTLLENVRFYPGEEANDGSFAQKLKQVIRPDYVVQDCFGVVHRAHASTEGISHLVPAVAGLLLESEVVAIESAMKNPAKPLVAVLGGAKISDKLPLVERLLQKADSLLIGGAMANNFFKQVGQAVGQSLIDEPGLESVAGILKKAKPGQLILPSDVAVGDMSEEEPKRYDKDLHSIASNESILDVGFETMRTFTQHIKAAGTIIWNGTLGMAEKPQFAQGSSVIAEAISKEFPDTASIIGGGDTADFVLKWQSEHKGAQFSHISTGGGASLELMSGQKLPGIEALLDR